MGVLLTAVDQETVPGHPSARQNTSPFYGAVVDLLTQPTVHLSGSRTQGGTWDVRATSRGDMLAQVTAYGQRTVLLGVDGRVYAKPTVTVLEANLPRGLSLSSVENKWVAGSEQLVTGIPKDVWSPRDLAVAFSDALDRTSDFPRIGDPAILVGAVQALEVMTPVGRLTVSANAPYRMLRFNPSALGEISSSATVASEQPGGEQTRSSSSLLRYPITFEAMSPEERARTFEDLSTAIGELNTAVDAGIGIDYKRDGDVRCDSQICTVTASVTNFTVADSGVRTMGTVTVVLRAAVTVNGVPSSGCTAVQSIPINRQATLTCADTSVGPLISKAKENRRAAEAPEPTIREGEIRYTALVDVQAQPLPRADIDRFVATVRTDKDNARDAANCGKLCDYKQIPYGGDPLSAAAGRARLYSGGRPWRNTVVALVPGWNDPNNGDLVIGTADGQSDNATGRSERLILDQLAAKGFKADQIASLYSERQPCFVICGSPLATGLRPKTVVSYSIPWLPNNAPGYIAGNDLLDRLTAESGGRPYGE